MTNDTPSGTEPAPEPMSEKTDRLDRPMELKFPTGLPYTVYFPAEDGQPRGSDLEHPAPLPRVGDMVEYIDERGQCQRYVVREVIHTLQTSAMHRPSVNAEPYAATAIPRDGQRTAEIPGDGGELRAGLPKVFLERATEAQR
jgi:hypothetical protein